MCTKMAIRFSLFALLAICGVVAHSNPVPDRIAEVGVDGTVLKVRLASGKVLAGADLVGGTLALTRPGLAPLRVKIEAVEPDAKDPDHELLLYRMLLVGTRGRPTGELCRADAEGQRWVFPVRGQWDAEGRHISDAGFTMTCSDGAQGKCVRFGYKPWKTLADGTSLRDYHQACIRMVRADYCGGQATTRDGMLIDVSDRIGILSPDTSSRATELRFEAAWTPSGAACVAHTRVPEKMTLEQLAARCPRLRGRLGDQACNLETSSIAENVLLFNSSRE
jgi:hypothetical protein